MLDDDIPAAEAAAIEGHVSHCPRCQAALEQLTADTAPGRDAKASGDEPVAEELRFLRDLETLPPSPPQPGRGRKATPTVPHPPSQRVSEGPSAQPRRTGSYVLAGISVLLVLWYGVLNLLYWAFPTLPVSTFEALDTAWRWFLVGALSGGLAGAVLGVLLQEEKRGSKGNVVRRVAWGVVLGSGIGLSVFGVQWLQTKPGPEGEVPPLQKENLPRFID
jgi:hypothetical protein